MNHGTNIGSAAEKKNMDKLVYFAFILCLVFAGFVLKIHEFQGFSFSEAHETLIHTEQIYPRKPSQPCTHAILRDIYRRKHYYPSEGRWTRTGDGTDYFGADFCRLEPRVSPPYMTRCLAKSNVTSIVTMGDSNGKKMSQALTTYLEQIAGACSMVSHEECVRLKPDIDFYTDTSEDWSEHIVTTYRHCACCGGRKHQCSLNNSADSQNITVEHLGLTQVIDDSIQIHVEDSEDGQRNLENIWAPTTQEFYFRYHLKNRYPDLLIVFMPFNHAKVMTVDRVALDLVYFKSLAELYLPNTTKIFYVPAFTEFESARKDSEYWYNRRFQRRLATDQIDKLNHKLFELNEKDFLDPTGRTYGFLDQLHISRDRGNWSAGAVHMQPVWYESTMSIFWNIFCNSVLHDAF